jgi:hypothetical protein
MAFTHIQGTGATSSGAILTLGETLGAAPTPGNLVCMGIIITYTGGSITSIGVKDGNGNVYKVTPKSPSPLITDGNGGTTGATYLAYLRPVPANPSATVTATWTGTTGTSGVQMFIDEFANPLGAGFDVDAEASSTTDATTITTPTITPTYPGSLLYTVAGSGGTISGVGGAWVAGGGGVQDGDEAAYILSASAATAVNFAQSSSGWSVMAMAFAPFPTPNDRSNMLLLGIN